MDIRELKGLQIAATKRVDFSNGAHVVPSQSGAATYRVKRTPTGETCSCEDFELRQQPCKHIFAVRYTLERERGGEQSVSDEAIQTVPKRPTYPRNWPAYNEAQINEKHRFQALLADLCRGLKPMRRFDRGRKPTSVADMIFAMALKVYSTFSARRFTGDMKDAQAKGYLSKMIHPMSIGHYFQKPELTSILQNLIVKAAMPLVGVEYEFAVDSSGFGTSRFDRWFDEKFGAHKRHSRYLKAHMMCGVKTKIVTAIEVTQEDANDSPRFEPLVRKTAESFTIKEVAADKAYLSKKHFELIEGLGAALFVPFKTNSLPNEGIWERMFHYYHLRRPEFLEHYHKRSNAESLFMMIKTKFRDSVRSREDTAMVNEVLAKFLCHNICVVIKSHCELGIEDFIWGEKPKEMLPPGSPN